jgi:HD-GYP domain-containing protein (c-di-GMP phosphodiesterase class II)
MGFGLSAPDLSELELFAALHDIGKIGIVDQILNKPGKLTDEEWAQMKRHSEIGYHIALSSPELTPIAEYILSHHERFDGSGYPQGISGQEIPFAARILAVADAYDAMTQDRVYRKALGKEEAIRELSSNRGTQFDPDVVDVFLRLLTENTI